MTANTPQQTSLDLLISLKSQYEFALTEASSKAVYLREQLAHVNALLLNQLLPASQLKPLQAQVETTQPLALSAQIEAVVKEKSVFTPSLAVTESISSPDTATVSKPSAQTRPSTKGSSKGEKVASKRNSLPLLPAYQGLLKLDAIAKVLEAERDREVSIDTVVQTLYGNLSAAEHKAERLRMKTALFQGVKKGLWQKSTTPSNYFIGSLTGQGRKTAKKSSTAKSSKEIAILDTTEVVLANKPPKTASALSSPRGSKATLSKPSTTSKRNSLPLLPEYAGMKKLDAIAMVLEKNRGEVLHHDTIIQMLYGDLSLADLKDERVRIKTALLTGVKNKRWQKSSMPSSYLLKSGSPASKPKSPIKTVKSRSSTKARLAKK
jgi:hypothetical protein